MINKILDFIEELAHWYQHLPKRDQNRVLRFLLRAAAAFTLLGGALAFLMEVFEKIKN